MSFNQIKEMNRNLCQDFCDLAGKKGNYALAWIYAILLDIIIPIALFFVGLTTALGGILLGMIIPALGGVLLGVVGIVVFLIIIGAYIIISFLEFREIGGFIIIPLFMFGASIVIGVIPILGLIAFLLSIVPWNIVAIVVHMFVYDRLSLGKKGG